MNNYAKIRAFVAANPQCSSRDILDGTGIENADRMACKMAQRGLLLATKGATGRGGERLNCYVIGRPLLQSRDMPDDERLRAKVARRRIDQDLRNARRKAARAAVVVIASGSVPPMRPARACQTVEDFIAAGGVVERLAGFGR